MSRLDRLHCTSDRISAMLREALADGDLVAVAVYRREWAKVRAVARLIERGVR